MPANKIKIDNAVLKRFKREKTKREKKVVRCNILIVCEGTKTEPYYFEAFKQQNRGTIVYDIDIKGLGKNTKSVVETAIELSKKALEPYDRVWAVFDKDSFPSKNFNEAIQVAESHGISCAWSNEAFELWYLYHFQNIVVAMNRADYKKAISNAVNNSNKYKEKKKYGYQKSDKENYRIMTTYGSQSNAIRWAEAQSKNFCDRSYAKHNPCTMVYKLVQQLIGEDAVLNEELKQKV